MDGKRFIDYVKEQVVEKLILDRLILEDAQRQGIEVTRQEWTRRLRKQRTYFGANKNSRKSYGSENE